MTGFVERALAFFERHQIVAKRLMTDNSFGYVKNGSLRELLARRGIRHLTTKPYRPRTNGKVERFHQTMAREWAYGLAYRSHEDRNAALCHRAETYRDRDPRGPRQATQDRQLRSCVRSWCPLSVHAKAETHGLGQEKPC